jgi:hypothetical protein
MATPKVSVSLLANLMAKAEHWAGGGDFSASIAQGLRRQVLADRRRHYLQELDARFARSPRKNPRRGAGCSVAKFSS